MIKTQIIPMDKLKIYKLFFNKEWIKKRKKNY